MLCYVKSCYVSKYERFLLNNVKRVNGCFTLFLKTQCQWILKMRPVLAYLLV